MIQETQLSTDENGNEIQNIRVTISVPVKDIAGLAAVNYDNFDYDTLSSKVKDEMDMSSLASDVMDEIDTDDLAEKVIDSINMKDLASALTDSIIISDYIDTDQIASEAADQIDVENKISTLLNDYNPRSSCSTGDAATKAIINAIRYDIMSRLYGQDRSHLDVTMTDVLRKFIKQELASIEEAKTTFTIGEIIDVLTGINSVNHKITEIVVAFSKAKPPAMNTLGEVIIKAD